MVSLEELETQVEELKKQVFYLSKNTNTPEESDPGSSGTGTTSQNNTYTTSDENWIVLYDKDSEDPALNYNKKEGLLTNAGNFLPPITKYNYLKIYYDFAGQVGYKEFDMRKKVYAYSFYTLTVFEENGNIAITAGFHFDKDESDEFFLRFEKSTKVTWLNGKTNVVTNSSTNTYYRYTKILVKV